MSFPNFPNKIKEEGVLSPKKLIDYNRKLKAYSIFNPPKGVILCFQKSIMNYIKKTYKLTEVKGFLGNFYLINKFRNEIGIIGNFGIGSPAVVTIIEVLHGFGIKNFIAVGIAGSLQRNLNFGDIVLASKALRDEGTSYHYLAPSEYSYPSSTLFEKVKKKLEENNIKFQMGPSWTIDAVFKETQSEIKNYQQKGILTVEMEASAIFSIGQYYKIHTCSLFVISDSLATLEWHAHYDPNKINKLLQNVLNLSILIIKDL